ncbi:MAG: hypothetical protein ACK4PR_04220 [Gammaproteobacteria bacterium]
MKPKIALQEVTWQAIRSRVTKVNSRLAAIIDKLSPDDSYTFFLAKYPYGANILSDGKLSFSSFDSGPLTFDSSILSNDIKHKLGYVMGTNPMTLVLKNSAELFITVEDRIVPYSLIPEGSIFGTWGFLEYEKPDKSFFVFTPIPLWDMTAGARSIFLLPKISEVAAFNRIQKKYEIKADVPKNLSEHWDVLKDIANHKTFNEKWETELLFFTRKWIDTIYDSDWHEFKSYIYQTAWNGSEFWRNQFCWDLTFTRIQSRRGIKPCPYIADMVSHLLAMSVGAIPGFRPLVDNTAAPIKGLMSVFEEEYGVKYAPIIIGPANFNILQSGQDAIYYSFHYPTALKLSPKSSSRSSLINDMYQINSLLKKYLQDITSSNLKIAGTALYEMAKVVQIDFYHYNADENLKMISSDNILSQDELFKKALKLCKVKEIPKNSPFLNGCVKISKN